ncbi:hypothetical protein CR513_52075, partial [Mucuna pruriens]
MAGKGLVLAENNFVEPRRSLLGYWLASTGKDLNKACPKDQYLLPSIDQLVDGASGCGLLNYMDAYSSYNQIRMHPHDEAKTVFATSTGTFCYKVMPFGLKNVGATNQRLMDRIFKDVMDQNMKVYVDKSTIARKHCSALRRGIEANLEKCQDVIDMRSLGTLRKCSNWQGGLWLYHISYPSRPKLPSLFFIA